MVEFCFVEISLTVSVCNFIITKRHVCDFDGKITPCGSEILM